VIRANAGLSLEAMFVSFVKHVGPENRKADRKTHGRLFKCGIAALTSHLQLFSSFTRKGACGLLNGEQLKFCGHQQLLYVHGNRDGVCVPEHLVERSVSLVLLQIFAQPTFVLAGRSNFERVYNCASCPSQLFKRYFYRMSVSCTIKGLFRHLLQDTGPCF